MTDAPECPRCGSDDTTLHGPFFGCNGCGIMLGDAEVIEALDADPDSPVDKAPGDLSYRLERDDE